MKEFIQDDFRQWYMEFKREHGKFPDFPEEQVWKQSGFKFTEFALNTTIVEKTSAQEQKVEEEGMLSEIIYSF